MRLVAIAILAMLVPHAAFADPEKPDADTVFSCNRKPGDVAVTFKPDTEVKELITWAMGFTCNQYVYDPRFVTNRHVTVIAPEKMNAGEAYELFLASLSTAGLAVVKKGHGWEIVESQAAKREAIPFVQHPGDGEQLVRFVLRPAYAKPETLAAAFESLRSDAGDIKQLGSLLVITDHAAHVQQMLGLARQVDMPTGGDGIYMIPVQHADATKLQSKIQDILATAKPDPNAPPPPKILVDERTNTLIVAGPQAAFDRVSALVERLDISLDIEGGASIHVYQLGNAVAEEVAKTLNDAIQHQQGGAGPKAASPADSLSLEGQVHVIADPKTNKLIVTASGRDFFAIRDVIQQLDEPRRQVFIETVILDVQTEDDLKAGTNSHGAIPTNNGNSLVLAGVQAGGGVSTLDLKDTLSGAAGLVAGVVGSQLTSSTTFLGTSIPSYALLFTALANSSNTNSVSTPSIIAVDNETTKFHVGQNVPYKRGVVPISATSPLSGSTTNIDRQDLNFELDIKPHISANDNVMLEVTNDAKEYGTDSDLGPSWNTRGFETRVVVHDQQTIVLTGLTQEHEAVSTSKVPLLGDIPLLGYLFKYSSRSKKRSNVLILLTPYIIKDQLDLQQILDRKTREHDEFVSSFRVLDHMPYIPRLDYRKKRGLVEEINRSLEAVDDDAAARAQLHPPVHVQGGAVQ